MIIRVSEVPVDGMTVEGPEVFPHPFDDPAWRLEAVHLAVHREEDDVRVEGHLRARVPQVCARCLDTFQVAVSRSVDTRFVPAPAGRADEHELATDDLETDVYTGDILDLASLVETETTLALPMKPLCRDSCRGLCPECGGNRNTTACSCAASPPDLRWAALRGLADRLVR